MINDMDKDLKFGKKGEHKLKGKIDRLFPIILLPYIKQYFFNLHPKEQLEGKDIEIPRTSLEVKTRRYRYRFYEDILLEIKTGYKKGWFYTSKSPFISYGFFNKEETDYLPNKAWILNIENCREYFTKERLEEYEIKEAISHRGGNYWKTLNKVIPIKSFPEDCLIPFPKDYWEKKKNNLEAFF